MIIIKSILGGKLSFFTPVFLDLFRNYYSKENVFLGQNLLFYLIMQMFDKLYQNINC